MERSFKHFATLIVILNLTAFGCLPRRTSEWGVSREDAQAIHALVQRREDSGKNGNVRAWVHCFTDDAIIMPANAPVVIGRKAIEQWESGFTRFRPNTAVTVEELVVCGDWAYMRSSIEGAFEKDGERFPIRGKELAILRRINGQWKYHRVCGNKDFGARFESSSPKDGSR